MSKYADRYFVDAWFGFRFINSDCIHTFEGHFLVVFLVIHNAVSVLCGIHESDELFDWQTQGYEAIVSWANCQTVLQRISQFHLHSANYANLPDNIWLDLLSCKHTHDALAHFTVSCDQIKLYSTIWECTRWNDAILNRHELHGH